MVELEGLSKRFGTVAAVDGIDLSIPEGRLLTLLGPSGCGKTTTLRMVAGLERPTAGRIRVAGRTVFGDGTEVPAEKRKIGMVFQSYAVWPHMTVFQNVAFPLKVRRRPRAEIASRTAAALDTVRLSALGERYPSALSGGQQQRVALARALVFDPALLLLDEPLSNLDAKLREEVRDEIRAVQKRTGVTALFVTHDQQEALAVSDLVAVMCEGRIVQLDTPQAIFDEPADSFVAGFVGWRTILPARMLGPGQGVEVDGHAVACATPALPPGTAVRLAARPEQLCLGDDPRGLPGLVRSAAFMGTHAAVEVECGGHLLHVADPARRVLAPGTAVRVCFDPAAVRVLPA